MNIGGWAGLTVAARRQQDVTRWHGYVQSYLMQGKSLEEAQRMADAAFPRASGRDVVDRFASGVFWFFVLLLVVFPIVAVLILDGKGGPLLFFLLTFPLAVWLVKKIRPRMTGRG